MGIAARGSPASNESGRLGLTSASQEIGAGDNPRPALAEAFGSVAADMRRAISGIRAARKSQVPSSPNGLSHLSGSIDDSLSSGQGVQVGACSGGALLSRGAFAFDRDAAAAGGA